MKKITTLITSAFIACLSYAQTADIARNVSGADIGDFHRAADFEFSFDTATNQDDISEYRLMVVKNGAAFNIDSAQGVVAANYISYSAPLADNVVDTLMAYATDTDGDTIVVNTGYRVYVLSIGTNADSLSSASSVVTLTNPNVYSVPFYEGFEGGSIPSDWTVVDNDNDGNEWDLSDAAGGTNTIGDYCISSASWINPNAVTPDNYILLPAIDLATGIDTSGTYELAWYVYAQDQDWPAENYTVYIDNAPFNLNDITNSGVAVFNETLTTSSNYMKRSFNLEDYKGDTIWVAFRHHDVTDEFRINVDDISVSLKPKFDIALNRVESSLSYTKIPLRQSVSGVTLSGNVTNNGVSQATNVTLNVNVNSGAYTDNSAPVNINSNSSQDLSIVDPFVPNGVGIYNMEVSATMDSSDANIGDNFTNLSFEVTDTVYSSSEGAASLLGGALAAYDNNEYGMLFEMFNDDTASSISVELFNPVPGAPVQVRLYEQVGVEFIEIGSSDSVFIPNNIPADEIYLFTLPLSFSPVISGKKYLATIIEFTGAESIGMTVDAASYINGIAYTNSDASGQMTPNDQFWTGDFLWPISLNLGNNIYTGVKEKVSVNSISLMPNPANDIVTLTDVKEYSTVQVIDVTGKVVLSVTNNVANNVTLNVSDLEAGVYVVKATGNDKVATQKLVVE